MTKILQEWKVLPHGKLTQVDEGILTVAGDLRMPLVDFSRRMTVVKLRDGRLVVYSAIALDEDEMTALEEFGAPAFLIVPGDRHRLDAKVWKDRYPSIKVVAPSGARAMVEETVGVDATEASFDDPDVTFSTVAGTNDHEAALTVRRTGGTTLVINDLIANMRSEGGFSAWMLRLMGYVGDEPGIPGYAKMKIIEDKAALRDQFLKWADDKDIVRIIVSHGTPIDEDPAKTLRSLAESLG